MSLGENSALSSSYLSGDKWELSGCSLFLPQPTVIVEVIALTLAPVKADDGSREIGWMPRIRRSVIDPET
jgi:hypothetical protein